MDITRAYRLAGGKSVERKYFSIFGHFKDPIKFATSPIKSAHHKGSMVYKTFFEAMAGVDWAQRRFTTMAELLGTDDKGVYKSSKKAGQPKGGKLRGQTVTFRPGRKGPISKERIPSFLLAQAKGSQPVQVQNLIAWLFGEMEAFDAVGQSMGLGISTTRGRKNPEEQNLATFEERLSDFRTIRRQYTNLFQKNQEKATKFKKDLGSKGRFLDEARAFEIKNNIYKRNINFLISSGEHVKAEIQGRKLQEVATEFNKLYDKTIK